MLSSTKHVTILPLQAFGAVICRSSSVQPCRVPNFAYRHTFAVPRRHFSPPAPASGNRRRNASKPESDHPEARRNLCNPYEYTAGRWLKHDKSERSSRYISFDFDALCRHAVELCHGAKKVQNYEKREGGNNRVFLLTTDTGERIVARLPFSVAGPPRLTTNSEVATLEYIRAKTTIPVPRVLSWNDDPSNPIGTEYIFLEHVKGVRLYDIWDTMTSLDHVKCIQAIAETMASTAKLSFPAYGSLYFADAPLPSTLTKIDIGDGICIGPNCGATYWNTVAEESSLYGTSDYNRGPWSDIFKYCSGLIASGYSRIPRANVSRSEILSYQGLPRDHIQLLQVAESILPKLLEGEQLQNLRKPILLHADNNTRNIFVSESDPTKITAIIDWQSTSIEPAFMYAHETPDFAAPETQIVGLNSSKDEQNDSKEERQRRRDRELCSDTFEVCMKGFIPVIGLARSTNQTLLRPFNYCNTTWRHGTASIRQDLLELSQQWTNLGLPGTCPFALSKEEIEEHTRQHEDFEMALNLKAGLMQILGVNSDGWVPVEEWESTKTAHKALYDQWMEQAENSEQEDMTPEKAEKLWPFDER